jgi:hypothetical protein
LHRQRLEALDNTPAAIADRIRRNGLLEQVRAEMLTRYPQITPENADEAVAWQDARMRELGATS